MTSCGRLRIVLGSDALDERMIVSQSTMEATVQSYSLPTTRDILLSLRVSGATNVLKPRVYRSKKHSAFGIASRGIVLCNPVGFSLRSGFFPTISDP